MVDTNEKSEFTKCKFHFHKINTLHQNSILFMINRFDYYVIYPNRVVIHYQLTLNGFRRRRGYYLRCDIHVYSILSSFLSFTEKYFFLFSSSSIEYRKETFNVICRLSNLIAAKYRFYLSFLKFISTLPHLWSLSYFFLPQYASFAFIKIFHYGKSNLRK